MKNIKTLSASLFVSLLALSLSACGPSAPQLQNSAGQTLEADSKTIEGSVEGTGLGSNTKMALYGAFMNATSGNRIDASNKTIDADTTLATAPVSDGTYRFALPKAPQKANAANLRLFVFNDANNNNLYDEGELKSAEANITWLPVVGYQGAKDADGNTVLSGLDGFKDFDFRFNTDTASSAVAVSVDASASSN